MKQLSFSIGNLALKKMLLYPTLEKQHTGISCYPDLLPLGADVIYFQEQILVTNKNISVKPELTL